MRMATNYKITRFKANPKYVSQEISLQKINTTIDPVAHMSDLKSLEIRLINRMDSGFSRLEKLILSKK